MFGLSKDKKVGPKYRYTDKELEELDRYISEQFGTFESVLHEIYSPDIHLDICVVDPTEEEPYYKLVTMGAGAYRMNTPAEYNELHPEYAEYVICLPATWNLRSDDEKDYWPIRALKDAARLPIMFDTWLCFGHTMRSDEEGTSYSENTKLNSVVLDEALEDVPRLVLSSGKVINFWKLIPLFDEELKYTMAYGADDLFALMKKEGTYPTELDIKRRNTFGPKSGNAQ